MVQGQERRLPDRPTAVRPDAVEHHELRKSKGKGKGPVCYHCGIQGHPWRLCPSLYPELANDVNQKGKGKGKPWAKGKGKGTYEVDHEDPGWSWEDELTQKESAQNQQDEIGEVQPWNVVVSHARTAKDMRSCKKKWPAQEESLTTTEPVAK